MCSHLCSWLLHCRWTDLVYKRSTDQGRTWSEMKVLYTNTSRTNPKPMVVIGNAAPVQVSSSCRDYAFGFVFISLNAKSNVCVRDCSCCDLPSSCCSHHN